MSDIEVIFYVYALLFGLVGFFAAGWVVATTVYCVRALLKGEPVRPVFREMLEEL